MIPLFSTNQIREADKFAIEQLGLSGSVLMENASIQIFETLRDKILYLGLGKKIGFVCGSGNNGGDGYAAARHFYNFGFDVIVIAIGFEDEMSPDCKQNIRVLKNLSLNEPKIKIKHFQNINDLRILNTCNVIVDAMLGTGVKGSLKEPYSQIVNALNKIDSYKTAIDIPTGLNADTGFGENIFKADFTVTLGEFKKGLFIQDGYSTCGDVVKGYIGLGFSYFDKYETSEYLIEPEDVYNYLPVKQKNIHKYSAGKVLTIAGSVELPGAAALTSMSVLKVGTGASIAAVPFGAKNFIHKKNTEVVIKTYGNTSNDYLIPEVVDELKEKINWADVIAIGPGLGRKPETISAVTKILKMKKKAKVVIDADAVVALSDMKYKEIDLRNCVLTPHLGEFSLLTGISTDEIKKDIFYHGKKFSIENKTYLVLKGAPTIIFSPSGDVVINTSGNPGMAKFGTGDVLSGVIAGFISQSKNIESSIAAGVYLHSLSADLLIKDYTVFGYTATDIMNNLPNAIKFIRDTFV